MPSHTLQAALRDLDSAYQAFFRKTAAYPRFRTRDRHLSFRLPDPAQFSLDVADSRLIFPKFGKTKTDNGSVKIKLHRPLLGRMKQMTITEEMGCWYVSIVVEIDIQPTDAPTPPVGALRVIGCDRGARHGAVVSRSVLLGQPLGPQEKRGGRRLVATRDLMTPAETAEDRKKTRRLSRAFSRKVKGSKNRTKARIRLARHLRALRRRRKHQALNAARAVMRAADVLVLEALDLKRMAERDDAAKGVSKDLKRRINHGMRDAGLAIFARRCEELAQIFGAQVIYVDPAYTSQTCHVCGHIAGTNRPKGSRRFACVSCGHSGDADEVASINISRKGIVILAEHGFSSGRVVKGTQGDKDHNQPRDPRGLSAGEEPHRDQGEDLVPGMQQKVAPCLRPITGSRQQGDIAPPF